MRQARLDDRTKQNVRASVGRSGACLLGVDCWQPTGLNFGIQSSELLHRDRRGDVHRAHVRECV
jgi:hypothetical protein